MQPKKMQIQVVLEGNQAKTRSGPCVNKSGGLLDDESKKDLVLLDSHVAPEPHSNCASRISPYAPCPFGTKHTKSKPLWMTLVIKE